VKNARKERNLLEFDSILRDIIKYIWNWFMEMIDQMIEQFVK